MSAENNAAPAAAAEVKRPQNFVNVEQLPLVGTADFKALLGTGDQWEHTPESEARFGIRHTRLGPMVGAKNIGTSYCELPPKKASWPFHYHLNNEEAIFIIEGEGIMSVPEGDFTVRKGDYIHFNAGKEHAHRLANSSAEHTLRYLCFGTQNGPDMAVYPSMGKLGMFDFEHGVGVRFLDLNDQGLPYYQRTKSAVYPFQENAVRRQSVATFDFENERPEAVAQQQPEQQNGEQE